MNSSNIILFNESNYIGSLDKKYIENSYTKNVELALYALIKRFFDIIIGFIGILFLIPLTILVKIMNLLTGDTKPIIFKQKRIGKNGDAIYIYKFRSMVPNAEELLEKLMKEDPKIKEEYLTNKKLENDPRVTKTGKFIRRTSIDEFPQFINVLKGDMSIVGPRPYLFREIDDMGFYYKYVINSKPGITGMWQVSGRNNVSFDKRLLLDQYYDNNKSIFLDTKIFFKTFKQVVKKEGSK